MIQSNTHSRFAAGMGEGIKKIMKRKRIITVHQFSLHQVGEFFGGLEVGTGLGGGTGHLVVTADEGFGE